MNNTKELIMELKKLFPELPERLTGIDLKMRVGEIPTMTVSYFPLSETGNVTKSFEIHERINPPEPPSSVLL